MKALVCKVSWMKRYHGEEILRPIDTPVKLGKEITNFMNFNGTYYGYVHTEAIDLFDEHHKKYDFVIFYATNLKGINKVVGWYKDAVVFKDEQLFDTDCPYFIKASDQGVVLLPEERRNLTINFNDTIKEINVENKLLHYLKKDNRINYRGGDENVSAAIHLNSADDANKLIEHEMVQENILKALMINQKAIELFGQLTTLVYYKAYLLYAFGQYDLASLILSKLTKTNSMREFSIFLLGTCFFETEGYQEAINVLSNIKQVNIDQSAYLISQSYAMLEQPKEAILWIEKALAYLPEDEVYLDFKAQLEEWAQSEV